MRLFNNFFRRKVMKAPVRTMRIDGVSIKMTPKPDDAELAAQALLEHMIEPKAKRRAKSAKEKTVDTTPSPAYYKQLGAKMREAHAAEARSCMRYLAYAEEELQQRPSREQMAEIEHGLYQFQSCVEREGGALKSRWQHCATECILLQQAQTDSETKQN